MAETETPRMFGPYLVERELGRGGMGVVYAATNEVFGGRAAVKVLLGEVSRDGTLVERFMNEARAASAIDHPSIVKVYDLGTSNDAVYIVMELLQGESLAARLKSRGVLPLATAVGLARQCANALEAAHKAGIVHRDLKPDNVFLVPDVEVVGGERVKLLDFGVAKLVGGAASVARTVTGAILGTPHYMSPEQCEGAREVDARSDLYSLGCMLFQMVSGRLPFQSPGIGGLIGMHLHVAPPLLRSVRPDAPAELEALIGKLLEKDPDVRIQTASDVAAALAQLPLTQSIDAAVPMRPTPMPVVDVLMPTVLSVVEPPKSEAPTITTKHTRRRWLWPALAAACAVVLAITISRRGDDESKRDDAPVAPPPVEVRRPTTPAPASGAERSKNMTPPAAPSALDSEIIDGRNRLREGKLAEALVLAERGLAKDPTRADALQLAKDAKHEITERVLAAMRMNLKAKRYGDVKRGFEEVSRISGDSAQRASAAQLWSKAKPEWLAGEQARKVAAETERVRIAYEASKASQIENATMRMGLGTKYAILSGCIDLLQLDRSRMNWDRCVRAQCDVNPGRVAGMIMHAPIPQQSGLHGICKPRTPTPQAPTQPKPLPTPTQVPAQTPTP